MPGVSKQGFVFFIYKKINLFKLRLKDETGKRTFTVTKTRNSGPMSPLCPMNYKPLIRRIQLQDYPNNYKNPIWSEELAEKVKKSMEYEFDDSGEKVNLCILIL